MREYSLELNLKHHALNSRTNNLEKELHSISSDQNSTKKKQLRTSINHIHQIIKSLIPIGDYKGFALAGMIDFLCGPLG
ncbi:MAG: hypothetical protein VW995_04690, partial [Deltaproteobacteria bacterium]